MINNNFINLITLAQFSLQVSTVILPSTVTFNGYIIVFIH